MADFCQECSIDLFGEDLGDLAGITTPEMEANGYYAAVLCEGCGGILVDVQGRRFDPTPPTSGNGEGGGNG